MNWIVRRMIAMIIFLFMAQPIASNRWVGDSFLIHVNLWENRLILWHQNEIIREYPIAAGSDISPTPIGVYQVIEKSKGWGGGFGTRWIGINVPWGTYGIHGTNKPHLIGKNISSGCIRMHNEHVEELFELVSVGTIVRIEGPITGTGRGEFIPLSLGSRGNLVQLVQQQLKVLGYYDGFVDGIFDLRTERAVKRFQKDHNLPVSGGITEKEYLLLGLIE